MLRVAVGELWFVILPLQTYATGVWSSTFKELFSKYVYGGESYLCGLFVWFICVVYFLAMFFRLLALYYFSIYFFEVPL
jgi:hypothetical protein